MQIIGIGKGKTWIVEISEKEWAQLAGFYGPYDEHMPSPKIGQQLDIGDCYAKAKEFLELHRDAQRAADQLRRAASAFLGYFKRSETNS